MGVLAFDTCLDACSVAWRGAAGEPAIWRFEPMRQGHAERLMPMIREVLDEAGQTPRELDAVALTIGPGTFTGTRVGIAAARGLVLATGARMRVATSLALVAATARAQAPRRYGGRPIAVCQDARKSEVLLELVRPAGEAALDGVRLLSPQAAALAIMAEAGDALLVGSAAALVASAAGGRLEIGQGELLPNARHLADMPLMALSRPSPLYARPPDARPQPAFQPRTP